MKKKIKIPNFLFPKMNFIKHIHFIGIGGSGMGGIAEILFLEGYIISGSDLIRNYITKKLINIGVKIYFKHCEKNIKNADLIVVSSAIMPNNPEIIAAKITGIPIILRAEMLAEIMRFRYGIAISGTHGKTTTTSMIYDMYCKSGLDPTCINGGLIQSIQSHAKLGNSNYLIVEADESDASFLYLKPIIIIVTNIAPDHMETYKGKFDNLKKTFIKFLNNLPFYGIAIICIDNITIRELLPKIKKNIITYGFSRDANINIKKYKQNTFQGTFQLIRKNKNTLNITLNIPGYHNALNAAAAIAVATEFGIKDKDILDTLKNFQGVKRRFEFLGCFSVINKNTIVSNILLVDDYGHHPTEIKETIKTIRTGWPNRKILMIFQPHRYTRTHYFYNELSTILSTVDELCILDVYAAYEKPISKTNSKSLCHSIQKQGKIKPIYIPNKENIINIITPMLIGEIFLLVQGAGDINKIAQSLAINIAKKSKKDLT